jgi:hypothetical protein
MATTTNYGWTTPDDTALVKDGAAAIRSLGTAIDTSFAADEGDLLVGGTSDIFEALPIGAVGTVLTSDGDTAEWAAPGAANENYSLINTGGTALTGSTTITVSGLNSDKLFIVMLGASITGTARDISFRFNSDTGSVYDSGGMLTNAAAAYDAGNFTTYSQIAGDQVYFVKTSSNANCVFNSTISVSACKSTTIRPFSGSAGANAAGGNSQQGQVFGGVYYGTAAITSFSVISSSGNFDAGTIYIYGAN